MLVLLMLFGGSAGAQTSQEVQVSDGSGRMLMKTGYLNLNVAQPGAVYSLSQDLSKVRYREPSPLDVHHAVSADVGLDAAVGLRVWRNLALGVGLTHFRTRSDVNVKGEVPHPLFFDEAREIQVQLEGFSGAEVGAHLQAAWTFRIAERLDVALSGGPSVFRLELDYVSAINPREVGTPDQRASFDQVQLDNSRGPVREQVPGANFGVDVTYHFLRRLDPGATFWTAGVGIFVRWTTGMLVLEEFGDETIEVGDLQTGAGLRFRF